MTYREMVKAGRPAFCHLDSGALLRCDAAGRDMQVLCYPARPTDVDGAVPYAGEVPVAGWRHHPGCPCEFCAGAAFAVSLAGARARDIHRKESVAGGVPHIYVKLPAGITVRGRERGVICCGETVGELLQRLLELVPRAREYVLDGTGTLRVAALLNGCDTGLLRGLDTPVQEGDRLSLIARTRGLRPCLASGGAESDGVSYESR